MSREKNGESREKTKDVEKEEIKEKEVKNTEEKTEKKAEACEKDKLKEELDALSDKYKRTLAEYDNFRKRSQKERDEFFGDGVSFALSQLLPVLDNLERAANASKDEGIKMIMKQFSDTLLKLDIKQIGEAGETFDPNLHNAVAHIDDESLGENVIAEVLQKGYTRNGRLIRPAMVKTAN